MELPPWAGQSLEKRVHAALAGIGRRDWRQGSSSCLETVPWLVSVGRIARCDYVDAAVEERGQSETVSRQDEHIAWCRMGVGFFRSCHQDPE